MSENKFNLPISSEESFDHYYLPGNYCNILLLSDIHAPYHSIRALTEALDYGIAKGIDCIFLNGDIMDCYMLSRFNPDPRKRSLPEEIETVGQLFDVLLGIAPVFWKLGNHEERLEKLLIIKAPELLGVKEFQLENLLRCGERKIEVIKDQRIVYVGKLPVLHGHEVRLANVAVNPARSLFLKTKKTAICGHLHRTSQHNETSLDGGLISTWSVGHLGEEHPKYARINGWNHGCARIEVNADGDFEVINLRIRGNKLFRS